MLSVTILTYLLSTLPFATAMLPTFLLAAILATQALAQRPCGFKIAPCPSDMVCAKTDPNCTRGGNCAGICELGPYYNEKAHQPHLQTSDPTTIITTTSSTKRRGCGVRMVGGVYNCEPNEKCIDDPKRPAGSCGMACDRPGICVKKVRKEIPAAQSKGYLCRSNEACASLWPRALKSS